MMMTVAEWRKKADDCMTASRLATDHDGQSGWRALSETWLQCAEWRDRVKFEGNETRIVVPITTNTDFERTGAIESGDRLRERLMLLTIPLPLLGRAEEVIE